MRTLWNGFRQLVERPEASVIAAAAFLAAAPVPAEEQTLRATVDVQSQIDRDAARSQVRISQLADQTQELLGEYRVALQRLDQLRIYNSHLQTLVDDQEEEKASINQQLEDFGDVEQGIVPLMIDMIDELEQFVRLDMPFQLEERTERIRRLRDNFDRADITISEKYRQIMEAYQIEASFGRDIEAYTGKLPDTGQEVDFLRVGRILLAYQSPDRAETGFWNKNTGQWEPLPDSYRASITQGLRIARKQAAPDLLRLPVTAPEDAR
jgi:hypothetical protein